MYKFYTLFYSPNTLGLSKPYLGLGLAILNLKLRFT